MISGIGSSYICLLTCLAWSAPTHPKKDEKSNIGCLLSNMQFQWAHQEGAGVCAGFAAQVGSTSPFAGFEGYHCGWGPPATMPVPRSNDTWGMGWQNLYEVEVMEMKAADLTQACLSQK